MGHGLDVSVKKIEKLGKPRFWLDQKDAVIRWVWKYRYSRSKFRVNTKLILDVLTLKHV